MAGSKHRGFEGHLYFTTAGGAKQKLANISGYELNIKAAEIDANDHDSNGWGDKLDGYKDWSVTIDHLYVDGDVTQEAMLDALLGSTDVITELRPVDVTSQANWNGTARITDYKETVKGATAQARNLTLSGRGALTRGTVSAS